MNVSGNNMVHNAQQPKDDARDCFNLAQPIFPSRVLSVEQRSRFEAKSNMNEALKDIRECGVLWNYTEFFRDRSIGRLADLLRSHSYQRLPIYSYGCSTGQEPYSLHLILRELFGSDYNVRFPITGYDLDVDCIEMAQSGCLLVDARGDSSEISHLRQWAKVGVELEEIADEKNLATIPDYEKVNFAKGDVRRQLFEFSEPVAIFLQNVLYHLSFDEQFAVMDRLCSLPGGSIVCLGSDTFTDRAAASILCRSGAFSRMCELKNVLMRHGPSIAPGADLCGDA